MRFNQSLVVAFLVMGIFVSPSMSIAGYQIPEWGMYIQYRTYEDRRESNRLYFEITDDSGNYISDGSVVTNVKLYDPSDQLVDIEPINFQPQCELILGGFNLASAQWEFDSGYPSSAFYTNILDSLVSGQYRLQVTTTEGQLPDKSYTYNQKIDNFPFFSSMTFEIYHDSYGNVYWSWDLPKEVLEIAENYSTSIRPYVDVYSGNQETAILWPTVQTHMNSLFIPSSVVQELMSKGDTYKFSVSFRTNDNHNRSYSKAVTVTDMLTTVSKKKLVAVIPMF